MKKIGAMLLLLVFPIPALAYLDLGSGSYFIQLFLGFFSVILLSFNAFSASLIRKFDLNILTVAAAALFPGFFLYGFNVEQTYIGSTIVPLIITLVLAYLLFAVTRLVLKDVQKATVFTALSVVLFFSYGHLNALLNDFIRDRYTLLLIGVLVISLFVYIYRSRLEFKKVASYAGVTFLVLSLSSLIYSAGYNISHGFNSKDKVVSEDTGESFMKPDIYYVILDGYGRQDVLKKLYNFDNATFLSELEKRGFYIAHESTANYAKTHFSLGSSLNFEYLENAEDPNILQQEIQNLPDDSKERTGIYEAVQNNKLLHYLHGIGYTSIHIGSGRTDMTDENPYAEISLKGGLFNEYTTRYLETSIAYPFIKKQIFKDDRNKIIFSFDSLKSVAQRVDGPKFVFAHTVATHPPFVFGSEGEPVVVSEEGENPWGTKDAYIDQLIYTNKIVLETIDVFLESSENPVIIIQGDHGPAASGSGPRGLGHFSEDLAAERMPILNVYHFSDICKDWLYPQISPVNSFRILLSCQFGADLPVLEDKSFFSSDSEQYKFIDVTDIVKRLN
jgi:hypothetical protein